MSEDFSKWLQSEMDQRDWGQAELGRRAGIDRQIIWKYLNSKTVKPDETVLQKLARAFKIPVEEVYRAAGILPPKPNANEWVEKITHVTNELPDDEKERVYQYAEMLREQLEKKSKRSSAKKK